MKIALGTVQFGLDYGISNKNGQIKLEDVGKILDIAFTNGIDTLDTAHAYGNAEEVLGKFNLSRFKVVTKLFANDSLEDSLNKLRVSNVYAVMFHRENQVDDKTWSYFERLKREGLTKKIGVSAYSPAILLDVVKKYPVDIVQVPMNMLDFRFYDVIKVLKQRNVEIHTRSAFLQGLLLMPVDALDSYFDEIKPVLEKIPEPRLRNSLHCLKGIREIDRIVVGVSCVQDLREIVAEYNAPSSNISVSYDDIRISDERFINPVNWPKKK